MVTRDEEFLKRLRATFKIEAEEHLQAIATGLLELEKLPAPQAQHKVMETVFRAAHSLKGAARAVDFSEIEAVCQSLENVFASWKLEEAAPRPDAFDLLHRALDTINGILTGSPGNNPFSDWPSLRYSLQQIENPAPSPPARAPVEAVPPQAVSTPNEEKITSNETVRVAVAKLEARLLDSEEMLTAKLVMNQRTADLRELARFFDTWKKEWALVEPEVRDLRQSRESRPDKKERRSSPGLTSLLNFFDWSVGYLALIENKTVTLGHTSEQDGHTVGKLINDLLEDSRKLLLLPFSTISASFPKLVRDLSRDQGKEADFKIRGEDIEIDKRILEEMKDPLIHLLRNSIDHGIEPAHERVQLGKPSRATITLEVAQVNGNKVQLLLSDDGAGIDTDRVKKSAIKHGLISVEEAISIGEAEAQALIFQSTISTSPIITEVSGRGLGLAIVREKTEKLGGQVSVESHPGSGASFHIVLPTTQATFRGILIEAGGQQWVVPTAQVERVASIRPDDVQTVEGRETISFGGHAVSLVWLADALELPPAAQGTSFTGAQVIVLGSGDQRVAFAVDAVLGEQEVLVKPLRKPLSRVRNIVAATVLGSGHVALILNVTDLLKSARKTVSAPARTVKGTAPKLIEAKTILVVEDSITSRMLLKGILESVGYNVKVAVDGMEGYTLLRAEKVDLVVSDVEMPRLNGFDLTARIRADKKLADLPIVLVTALESREDREHGIDVGANAYLVKSNFDQSNLLEAIQRLI